VSLRFIKTYIIINDYKHNKYQKETIVQRKTKSLLEELNSISDKKNSEAIIESRATHVIDSAINLLSLIRESFNPEDAYELERRLINSIKGADVNKFTRGIRKIRDSKETARHLTIIEGDVKDD
jgi:hypothetical protein